MRIISGTAKGRKLISPKTWNVRPTADQVKESLFNIIAHNSEFNDKLFLDLFAGTGNIGIEALSRGVNHAVFVEKDHRNAKIIQQNLTNLGFTSQAEVLKIDAVAGIKLLGRKKKKFDFIFLDPPYKQGLINPTLEAIEKVEIINPGGMIIIEHHRDEQLEKKLGKFVMFDQRTYGSTQISFYN